MKKIYKTFIIGCWLLAATASQAQDPLYTLKNFASATSLQAPEDPYNISVTAVNAEIHSLVASVLCMNINGTTQGLKLVKTSTPAYGYIDIANANPEDYVIERIEIAGSSSGAGDSFAVIAVSTDGTTFPIGPNGLHYTASEPGNNLAKVVAFPVEPNESCASMLNYIIPETAYKGTAGNSDRTPVPDFQQQVRLIRLQWGAALGGVNSINTTWSPYIYGIKIYVKLTGTATADSRYERTAVESRCYDLTGKSAPENAKGFLIRKTVYDDGSASYLKVYAR